MTNSSKRGAVSALILAAAAFGVAQGISVTVDGRPVQFDTTGPIYENGRVLVPLRGVFEQMGAYVDWDPATRLVTANRGDTDVRLHIGDRWAEVNGERTALDTPPRIYRGSTMVPLRFLSESLGANVEWVDANREVMITSAAGSSSTSVVRTRSGLRRAAIRMPANTVIPVTLDEELSSRNSSKGDRFMATVRTNGTDYDGLPDGTKIEGVVTAAHPQTGRNPGLLDLSFRRVILPNGESYPITGSLTSLGSDRVDRNADGVLVARTDRQDNRMVYAGYGAAGGLLVGLVTKRPIEGTVLGGVLGYLYGQVSHDQEKTDVDLAPGTRFGVRLDQRLAITR